MPSDLDVEYFLVLYTIYIEKLIVFGAVHRVGLSRPKNVHRGCPGSWDLRGGVGFPSRVPGLAHRPAEVRPSRT